MRVAAGDISKYIGRYSETDLQRIAQTSGRWENLFHFSDGRANVVEWMGVKENAKALEIGAQAGAISSVIIDKYSSYAALDIDECFADLCKKRIRNEKLEYHISAVHEYARDHLKEYDDIYMVGVLADAACYMGKDDSFDELLQCAGDMLKEDGRLILATENKLGLKYWAGCQEEYNGGYNINIESFPNGEKKKTFSKGELERELNAAGFTHLEWYYPYPDLYFAGQIYSDEYLPKKGELICNINNYDKNRYLFFDEAKVFDTLIDEGEFPLFSNSFLVIGAKNKRNGERVVYVKYAKKRREEFAIRTEIVQNREEEEPPFIVRKVPLSLKSKEHVERMLRFYNNNKNGINGVNYNRCQAGIIGAEFEFIDGDNLQDQLEQYVLTGREKDMEKLFDHYVNKLFHRDDVSDFEKSEGFAEVFGDVDIPEKTPAVIGADIDLICSNILIRNGEWNLIDYEWTFDFPIPLHYMMYRAFFLAGHQIRRCEFLKMENLMKKYGIAEEEASVFATMEDNFQKYVRGNVISNIEVHRRIGKRVYTINEMIKTANDNVVLEKRVAQLLSERSYVKAAVHKMLRFLRRG